MYWKMFKFCFKYGQNYKLLMFYTFILLLTAACGIIAPLMVANIIDLFVAGGRDLFAYLPLLAIYALSSAISAIIYFLDPYILSRLYVRVFFKISAYIMNVFQHLPYGFFNDFDAGDWYQRIETNTNKLCFLYYEVTPAILVNVCKIVAMCILVGSFSIKALAVCLLAGIVIFFIYVRLSKWLEKTSADWLVAMGKIFAIFLNQISNVLFIHRNNLFNKSKEIVSGVEDEMLGVYTEAEKSEAYISGINQLVVAVLSVSVLAVIIPDVLAGTTSAGTIVVLYSYATELCLSIKELVENSFKKISQTLANYKEVVEIEQYPKEKVGSLKLETVDTVELKNVTYTHPISGAKLAEDFSQKFCKGKVYALQGENGCGKTSMFHLIAGEFPENYKGEIYYNNKSLHDINQYELRTDRVKLIDQDPIFLAGTLRDNLTLYCKDKLSDESLYMWLDRFGLSYLRDKDDGLNTVLSANHIPYSGGEQQKLSIIRSLLVQPSVLLLDEPTSALDVKSTDDLIHILESLKNDMIIIFITHDSKFIDFADEIVRLQKVA